MIGVRENIGLDDALSNSQSVARRYKFLRHMDITLQFFDAAGRSIALRSGVLYVYIEDFGGWAVLPKVEAPSLSLREAYPAIENDLAAVRSRLNDVGFGCHKEAMGLPDALGYQVIQKDTFAVNCDNKRASADGLHKKRLFSWRQ